MEKNKSLLTKTGIMQKLVVYSQGGGAIIGTGWVIHTPFQTFKPTLIALDGNTLPEGWYDLRIVDDGVLVVLNDGVH